MSVLLPRRALVCAAALCFLLTAHAAQPQQALLAADMARIQALLASDLPALERLLADDLTYVHTTAEADSKGRLLGKIRSGELVYQGITTHEVAARAYGTAGVVTGLAELHVLKEHQPRTLSTRYTATYIQHGGQWQLVAYQSTQLPPP
jgi:ketosteroid isomerase-like protein